MDQSTTLHASCVALDGDGVLIVGASGSGKSGLALQLMAYGCALVADDKVVLNQTGKGVVATAPQTITGLIEARGIGILDAHVQTACLINLVVDLDRREDNRLPPQRVFTILGHSLPLIYRSDTPQFAAGILQLLKSGWSDR